MARITVEDCLKKIENPFELVLLAAQRSRDLMRGLPSHYDVKKEKHTVISLREIADGAVNREDLIARLPTQRLPFEATAPSPKRRDSASSLEQLEAAFRPTTDSFSKTSAEPRESVDDMISAELQKMFGAQEASAEELAETVPETPPKED